MKPMRTALPALVLPALLLAGPALADSDFGGGGGGDPGGGGGGW